MKAFVFIVKKINFAIFFDLDFIIPRIME
jgi:hypothetical protein